MRLALQGYKNAEIARELGIAEGTVHSHKKLGYKKLKSGLKPTDFFKLLIYSFFV